MISVFLKRSTYRCAILRSFESIDFGSTWNNWAFRQAVGAVHFIRTQLSQPMPVDTGSIVLKVIGDGDFNVISPVGLDSLFRVSLISYDSSFARTGPGYCPLKTDMGRSKPSGAIVTFVISR